jgi:hypothetical protein
MLLRHKADHKNKKGNTTMKTLREIIENRKTKAQNNPNIVTILNELKTRISSKKTIPQKQQTNLRCEDPINAGLRWKYNDKLEVVDAYNQGFDISDIADETGRSDGSIRSVLKDQGVDLPFYKYNPSSDIAIEIIPEIESGNRVNYYSEYMRTQNLIDSANC